MIYNITTVIGTKEEKKQFYDKMAAVTHYRLRLKEMTFPDEVLVEVLNDGE